MKTVCMLVAIAAMSVTSVFATTPTRPRVEAVRPASKTPSYGPLVAALIEKESSGRDYALGDTNLTQWAYGPLQIREDCVRDVNERFGTRYTSKDMYGNRALSVWVCQKYLERFATRKLLGHEPTDEDRARIWNGGPSGWKKKSTIGYWTKVQKIMTKYK